MKLMEENKKLGLEIDLTKNKVHMYGLDTARLVDYKYLGIDMSITQNGTLHSTIKGGNIPGRKAIKSLNNILWD